MKKSKSIVFRIFSLLIPFLILFSAVSAYTVNENKYVDGVAYKLSEDGSYYTVVGYSDVIPNVEIASEIDGIPVTAIAESAFQNNADIVKVSVPDSVKTIGTAAFRNCANLTSVTLPSGLTALPGECFYDCRVLKSVNLPDSLQSIGDFCFQNCTLLGNVTVPASVTEIGYDAFLNCESILLDVSKNPYAADYAARFNINTSFEGTTGYFLMMIGIGTAVGLVIVSVLIFAGKKYFSAHPDKAPSIWLSKLFAPVGKLLKLIVSFISKIINYCIDFLLDIIIFFKKRKKSSESTTNDTELTAKENASVAGKSDITVDNVNTEKDSEQPKTSEYTEKDEAEK